MYERVVFIFFPVERPLDIFKKSALEFYEEYVNQPCVNYLFGEGEIA